MVNQSKKEDQRCWNKWRKSGAVGNIDGRAIGEAYAFFYCDSPMERIKRAIPFLREDSQTPSELELSLYQGNEIAERTKNNPKLNYLADRAKMDGTNILMYGKYLPKTNKETADELATLLNTSYASELYENKNEFIGGIIYKQDGEYVFRD